MSRDWSTFDWQGAVYNQGDLIPGDPYAVAQLGQELRRTADMITQQVASLRNLTNGEGWDSDSGKAFQEKVGSTADLLQKAFGRYDEAATAIGQNPDLCAVDGADWAAHLQEAQTAAKQALRQGQQADADRTHAQNQVNALQNPTQTPATPGLPNPSPGPAPLDPHSPQAQALQSANDAVLAAGRAMQAAIDRRDAAGHSVAAAINHFIDHDGLKSHWWDNWKNWVADLGHIAGMLSAVFGVLALVFAWCPFIAGPLALAAAITGVVALICDTVSALDGKGNWFDVALDVVGVLSFGAGRVLGEGVKVGAEAAQGLEVMSKAGKMIDAGDNFSRSWSVAAKLSGAVTKDGKAIGRLDLLTAVGKGFGDWMPTGGKMFKSLVNPFSAGAGLNDVVGGLGKAMGSPFFGKTLAYGTAWFGSQTLPIAAAVGNFQIPDDFKSWEPKIFGPNLFHGSLFSKGVDEFFNWSPLAPAAGAGG